MLEQFLILILITAGISSAWMYSSLLCELNNWWKVYFLNMSESLRLARKYKECNYFKPFEILCYKISKLATCNLCISFWIANCIQRRYLFYDGLPMYILNSFAIAMGSWLLTSIVVKLVGDKL